MLIFGPLSPKEQKKTTSTKTKMNKNTHDRNYKTNPTTLKISLHEIRVARWSYSQGKKVKPPPPKRLILSSN